MDLHGEWLVQVGSFGIGCEINRANLLEIRFGAGQITLPDGSHPEFTHDTSLGYARLAFDVTVDDTLARFVIDRGDSSTLNGWCYFLRSPQPNDPMVPSEEATMRRQPLLFMRPEHLDRVERDRADLEAGVGPMAEMLNRMQADLDEPERFAKASH